MATNGATSVSLSGGSIPAGGSCTITLTVKMMTGGVKVNTTGPISSANGGTGTASNTATVAAFDICLQDNTTGDLLQWSSTTGDYLFTHCSSGFMLVGKGTTSLVNGIQNLSDSKPDRRISAGFNTGQLTGHATVTIITGPGLSQTYTINQTTPHPTCACPVKTASQPSAIDR